MTGANSAVGLRSMAARFLFLDEVDAYPGDVEGEGDPVNLAMARTRTFARRKVFLCSTPKITGMSRIEAAYEESDQRRYLGAVPDLPRVPGSEVRATPVAEGTTRRRRPTFASTAGRRLQNHQKQWMLPRGRVARGTRRATAGRRASTFPACTRRWVGSPGPTPRSTSSRRRRIPRCSRSSSTRCWARRGRCWAKLRIGRSSMTAASPIRSAPFRVAGCSWLPARTFRRTASRSRWSRTDAARSPGRSITAYSRATPRGRRCGRSSRALLSETYPAASGIELPILQLAVDSGFATTEVYQWARRQGGRVLVIKGDCAGAGAARVGVSGRGRPAGREVQAGHSRLAGELRHGEGGVRTGGCAWNGPPTKTSRRGILFPPGYCHFPQVQRRVLQADHRRATGHEDREGLPAARVAEDARAQ